LKGLCPVYLGARRHCHHNRKLGALFPRARPREFPSNARPPLPAALVSRGIRRLLS
jgi:hypothetical protein